MTRRRGCCHDDKVILEAYGSGNAKARNVHGLNLISKKVGNTKVYYFYNAHGDVTALMDAATGNKNIRGCSCSIHRKEFY